MQHLLQEARHGSNLEYPGMDEWIKKNKNSGQKKGGMLIIFTVGLGDPDCFDTPTSGEPWISRLYCSGAEGGKTGWSGR